MAAVARVAFPSTSRRPSTLPVSSTTTLSTTVPSVPPRLASTGYGAGTLCASRFSAPLEERMIALFSHGSSALAEVAAGGVAAAPVAALAAKFGAVDGGLFGAVGDGDAGPALVAGAR